VLDFFVFKHICGYPCKSAAEFIFFSHGFFLSLTEGRGQKAEGSSQLANTGMCYFFFPEGLQNFSGLAIMLPSIFPISLQFLSN